MLPMFDCQSNMDRVDLVQNLTRAEPAAIIRTLAVMANIPSIGKSSRTRRR
jgi:hypothetical protein